jgi:hypothetical protein
MKTDKTNYDAQRELNFDLLLKVAIKQFPRSLKIYTHTHTHTQMFFFETMQLSTCTKPILKEVFINYIQNKVIQ